MRAAEQRYDINEHECLALVWGCQTLKTDSNASTWLQRYKESKSKLLRWALLLQELNFKIEHCPKKILSRATDEEDAFTTNIASMDVQEPFPKLAKNAQTDDALTQELIRRRDDPTDPDYQLVVEQICNHDGVLYRAAATNEPKRLYVPSPLLTRVLQEWHDNAGHPGRDQS